MFLFNKYKYMRNYCEYYKVIQFKKYFFSNH